jgi:hypothetical protein
MRGMNSRTQGRDGYDVPTAHHAHGAATGLRIQTSLRGCPAILDSHRLRHRLSALRLLSALSALRVPAPVTEAIQLSHNPTACPPIAPLHIIPRSELWDAERHRSFFGSFFGNGGIFSPGSRGPGEFRVNSLMES